jgi:predicted dehydrogenase
MKAKELIDSGKFGEILWMRGRYGKSVDPDFGSSWRSKKEYSGGGILMDQGIHMLDLMLHFCGNFEEAKAYASNLYWKGEIEDNVFAILRNKKGQVASLHSTMTQWRYLFSLEIFLMGGSIIVNGLLSKSGRYGQEKLAYAINQSTSPMTTKFPDTTVSKFDIDESWDLEINEFTNAIQNNEKIDTGNSQDALKLMTLIEKIYEDSKKS